MPRSRKVLVLFDYPYRPAKDEVWGASIREEDWRCEREVLETLKTLGHEVTPFGIHDRVRPLLLEIRRRPPDIVFNLAEAYANVRANEANLAGFLELLNVPYTGCRSNALSLCRHKGITQRLLATHHLKVPRSVTLPLLNRRASLKNLKFPVIVKPLGLEGSDGIAQSSFAEDPEACWARVKYLHESLKTDVTVEEYIEGRELYSGVLGNLRLTVLPAREMFFGKLGEDRPRIATFKAKWDDQYRKERGIRNDFAKDLPEEIRKRIASISRTAYRALGLNGYARLDLRLTPANELYILEVNPNPGLATNDEIATAALQAGISYPQLIQRILDYGLQIPPFGNRPPSRGA